MSIYTHDYFAEQAEFTGDTVVDLDVPSGQLIAADHLRLVEHFNVEPLLSINSGVGLAASDPNAPYCLPTTKQGDLLLQESKIERLLALEYRWTL